MKKIILAAAMISAFATASYAAQRSYDPDFTVNGRALSYIPTESTTASVGSSSALAIESNAASSSAFERLEMNSFAATHGDKAN